MSIAMEVRIKTLERLAATLGDANVRQNDRLQLMEKEFASLSEDVAKLKALMERRTLTRTNAK